MLWKVEEKGFFCSLAPIGVGFSGIMCNLTPYYDGLVRKVLQDDDLAPFSSDKIRAKILDLGYGGPRRALHNLSPKSARILSAAITRKTLPPAGVRIGPPQGLGHLVTTSTHK